MKQAWNGLPIGVGTGLPQRSITRRRKIMVDDDSGGGGNKDDVVDVKLLEFITAYRALDPENREDFFDLMNDFLDDIGGDDNLTEKQKEYIQRELVRDGDKFNLMEETNVDEFDDDY